MNKKNMNESEKILYALDMLQLTTKDDKKKEEISQLIDALKTKMGKTVTEEVEEEQQAEVIEEKKEDE